jgi:hydrogenase expression/formation protein HypC
MCLAIPGQIVGEVDRRTQLAPVEIGGVRRMVNVGLLDGGGSSVECGDWVLIHVGFALSKVDEDEAQATLELLRRMGDAYEQELAELTASAIE